jgi:P4 family phage/plasmid primase-like protien
MSESSGEQRPEVVEAVRRLAAMPKRTQREKEIRNAEIGRTAAELGVLPLEMQVMVQNAGGESVGPARAANDDEPEYDAAQQTLMKKWVEENRGTWRHVQMWKTWMRWTGDRWAADERNGHACSIQDFLAAFVEENEMEGPGRRALLSADQVSAVGGMTRARPEVTAVPRDFDADPYLLNTPTGIVDLRTGTCVPHYPGALQTKISGAGPIAGSECPLFLTFLREIMLDRQDLIDYVLDFFAVALVGEQLEHLLVLFYGTGRNGKSALLRVLSALFGDYAGVMPEGLLTMRRNETHPAELATLRGKRLMIASETKGGATWDEERVKRLTGGEDVTARGMGENFYTFPASHSLVMAVNKPPKSKDVDVAMLARMRIVPFDFRVPEERIDPLLVGKLLEEREAIMRMLVERCAARLRAGGLMVTPPAVMLRTEAWADEQDPVGRFLRECCVMDPQAVAKSSYLFSAFNQWHGGVVQMAKQRFGFLLSKKGIRTRRGHDRERTGVRLREEVLREVEAAERDDDLFNSGVPDAGDAWDEGRE